jgi:hypothetical protein
VNGFRLRLESSKPITTQPSPVLVLVFNCTPTHFSDSRLRLNNNNNMIIASGAFEKISQVVYFKALDSIPGSAFPDMFSLHVKYYR